MTLNQCDISTYLRFWSFDERDSSQQTEFRKTR